eukprot:m.222875 g.222875  ORF g.222875 m.222875 type:complete len:62 (+) comp17026_c3_seq1:10515-10700(+)
MHVSLFNPPQMYYSGVMVGFLFVQCVVTHSSLSKQQILFLCVHRLPVSCCGQVNVISPLLV